MLPQYACLVVPLFVIECDLLNALWPYYIIHWEIQ